ncbi:hypothetical protein [Vibrio sp. LaRot3]|uniref:hypothetical protein n=1 Tax=Vibrio sp. LaRot3 TaxID=2998829 RepID=UPI0022CE2419|nr:hypothetical protein [Vibrio sp. LaRot3]MDA0150673.1 hypothetical protein [Vibrio sp. LaRot3]
MTTENYSITELKDLLNDLENLSTCLMTLPEEHVDASALSQLFEDQFSLIQKINGYATMLRAIDLGDLPK